MKGISEILSITIVTLITLTVFSGFFYWYSNISEDSKIGSEDYTKEIQSQIITTSNKIIDDLYDVSKEKNINNFGELTYTIEAEDGPISIDSEDSSFSLYEGYGSNTELICSDFGLNCNCENEIQKIFGVLVNNDTTKGIYFLEYDSINGFSEKQLKIFGNSNNIRRCDIRYFDQFVEGGNDCNEPKNLLATGYCTDDDSFYEKATFVLDSNLDGSYYDLYDTGDLEKIFDVQFVNDILVDDTYHLFSGAFTDYFNDSNYNKQVLSFSDLIYGDYENLGSFGLLPTETGNAGLAVTAMELVYRNNYPALLFGTSHEEATITGGAYLAISDEPENNAIFQGNFRAFTSGFDCPYDMGTFLSAGFDIAKIANCDIDFNSVVEIVKTDLVEDTYIDSDPVILGLNEVTDGITTLPIAVFFTDYNYTSTRIYNLDLSTLGLPLDVKITHMFYDDSNDRVFILLESTIPGSLTTQVIVIDHNFVTLTPHLIELSGAIDPSLDVESFTVINNTLFFGGNYNDGMGTNQSEIYTAVFDEETFGLSSVNRVYSNNTFYSVSNLVTLNLCEEKSPYLETECDIKRGESCEIILNIEDTDCDISDYPSETQFSSTLTFGKNKIYEIFKKGSDPSEETDLVVV